MTGPELAIGPPWRVRTWDKRVEQLRARHRDKDFKPPDVPAWVVRAYDQRQRVKVRFYGTEIKSGTIGMSTGWQPVALLILTSRSMGSSWIIDQRTELLGIKRGRVYVEV